MGFEPPSSELLLRALLFFTTLGPVTNMYDVWSTIIVKSVIASEYLHLGMDP